MCDEMDAIQEQQLQLTWLLTESARRRAFLPGKSATNCTQCGERINEARRTALPGVQLCIDCQSKTERPEQLYSGKYR